MIKKSLQGAVVGLIVGPVSAVVGAAIASVIMGIASVTTRVFSTVSDAILSTFCFGLLASIMGVQIGIIVGVLNAGVNFRRRAPLVWAIIAGLGAGLGGVAILGLDGIVSDGVFIAIIGAMSGWLVDRHTSPYFDFDPCYEETRITKKTLTSYLLGFLSVAVAVYKVLGFLVASIEAAID